ncbi:hypothetical protein KIN34_06405 [Cellulomonas sp. DKR-3]|uniref:Uncharacterized protein n=1 Tax=Cellulomonas fulva TaxID=2835530 RepID=A0ABS5TXN8_9CELL|nr:hypothetical protein [Cellulomonas fulva]MBT0993917.1 hypothetical protein [Cellulomonas fulva]
MMQTFPAKRASRTGALVVVTDPATAAALVGQLIELVAPDGSTAHGRVTGVGRTWTTPDGRDAAYAYLDPASITADVA